MSVTDFAEALGPTVLRALEKKGFTELTAVQQAVLAPDLQGRDLRITSQTGSGKTIAIGLAIRDVAMTPAPAVKGIARPFALVVAPTRELARQVEDELRWLYAEAKARVASATGGASYRDEHRALAAGPSVVVGTPGRLLDHLKRGGINTENVAAIVLDEADRMLDLGFREDLEAIFDLLPDEHRTHLCSATFPRDVKSLADRVQHNAVNVEGTRLGAANVDIDHVIHLVDARQKIDALVNVLLSNGGTQTLVFARTRADVGDIAQELSESGFGVCSLSGDMDQNARNRALASFKRGDLRVLVATDVAARGIDVQDIGNVIHVDVPTDADSYTHRSGRTGRAGRRGMSSLLVSPAELGRATRVLRIASISPRLVPVPNANDIRKAADERLFEELTREDESDVEIDPRAEALAARLVEHSDAARIVARLLRGSDVGGPSPRDVRVVQSSGASSLGRGPKQKGPARRDSGPREAPHREASHRGPGHREAPHREPGHRGPNHREAPHREPGHREPSRREPSHDGGSEQWVPFRISWGSEHGADARRLLAMVCRRGQVEGKSVGPIRVEPTFSIVNVAAPAAEAFARAVSKPDDNPRDRRTVIQPDRQPPPRGPRRIVGAKPGPAPSGARRS